MHDMSNPVFWENMLGDNLHGLSYHMSGKNKIKKKKKKKKKQQKKTQKKTKNKKNKKNNNIKQTNKQQKTNPISFALQRRQFA